MTRLHLMSSVSLGLGVLACGGTSDPVEAVADAAQAVDAPASADDAPFSADDAHPGDATPVTPTPDAALVPGEPPADLVLTGGVVQTMDAAGTSAEALAVRAGRIVFVGPAAEAAAYIGPETEVVELAGRAVLPGFIDAHTHLVWSATELLNVDLFDAETVEDLLDRIRARAEAAPDEEWVRGSGWDLSIFDGELDKEMLDAIVPDQLVYMESSDAHSAWVNSAALALAGIDRDTPDPPRGRIERDAQGEPTGILREDAMSLVAGELPEYSDSQIEQGLADGLAEAASFGITTIVDANCDVWMLEAYQRFETNGRLSVRVRGAIEVDPDSGAEQVDEVIALRDAYASPLVQVNAGKFYLDGVIESQTAYMLEPYTDGENGTPNFTDDALAELAIAFDVAGLQLHAHAIGDGAIRQMLDAVEATNEANGPRDRRPLLAHIEVIDAADLPRFAELGAYADFQPLWAYPDTYVTELTLPVIGEARGESLYPIGAVQEAGGTIVAGSDWSVSSMNPFEGMEVAVTRQAPDDPEGDVLTPAHRVDLRTILSAYTSVGAKAVFAEADLGTLEVGKLADLVLVDRDPFAVEPHELSDLQVEGTWLEGRRVFGGDVE